MREGADSPYDVTASDFHDLGQEDWDDLVALQWSFLSEHWPSDTLGSRDEIEKSLRAMGHGRAWIVRSPRPEPLACMAIVLPSKSKFASCWVYTMPSSRARPLDLHLFGFGHEFLREHGIEGVLVPTSSIVENAMSIVTQIDSEVRSPKYTRMARSDSTIP